jgi:hypothetical protein
MLSYLNLRCMKGWLSVCDFSLCPLSLCEVCVLGSVFVSGLDLGFSRGQKRVFGEGAFQEFLYRPVFVG